MKEKPILFSGPMIRAILDGRKTQTRRVVKIPHGYHPKHYLGIVAGLHVWEGVDKWGGQLACPYGQPGDRLWVRETWAARPAWDGVKPSDIPQGYAVYYRATEDVAVTLWRPSIFMPRWASRITLEIINIRVERLQEISTADIQAEGALPPDYPNGTYIAEFDWERRLWREGWDTINGKRPGCAWADNPWVWCISFKQVPPQQPETTEQ